MAEDLVLLGRWYEPPLITWPGYCDAAQDAFEQRTGFRLRPFVLAHGGAYEHYYFASATEPLREHFMGLSGAQKLAFACDIYGHYYANADNLDRLSDRLAAANLVKAGDDELEAFVRDWMVTPGQLAGSAFFAGLMDIWYEDRRAEVEHDKDLAEVFRIATFARDHCTYVWDVRADPQAKRLFDEIAHRLGITGDDIEMLFPEEILQWLGGDATVGDRIAPRRDFFLAENRDGHFHIMSEEEAGTRLGEVTLAKSGTPSRHLSGIPAYKGEVQGRARRVLAPHDFGSFEDGDILVAYNTSKCYEPLFERAGAVLTELGGLTSHAAVISAEMGLPCVVGVKDLVVSVQSGDELAVDASAGTVEVRHR